MPCPDFHQADKEPLRALARRFYLIAAVFTDEPIVRLGSLALTKDWHKSGDYPGAIPERSFDAFAWAFGQAVACVKGETGADALLDAYRGAFGLNDEDVKWQPYSPISSSKR